MGGDLRVEANPGSTVHTGLTVEVLHAGGEGLEHRRESLQDAGGLHHLQSNIEGHKVIFNTPDTGSVAGNIPGISITVK